MNDSEVKGGAKSWADTIRVEWRGWLAVVAVVLILLFYERRDQPRQEKP